MAAANNWFELSRRQLVVLELILAGRSNNGIAGDLKISLRAVEIHITLIYRKMDISKGPDVNCRVTALGRVLRALIAEEHLKLMQEDAELTERLCKKLSLRTANQAQEKKERIEHVHSGSNGYSARVRPATLLEELRALQQVND
jgi:hypothetical protein